MRPGRTMRRSRSPNTGWREGGRAQGTPRVSAQAGGLWLGSPAPLPTAPAPHCPAHQPSPAGARPLCLLPLSPLPRILAARASSQNPIPACPPHPNPRSAAPTHQHLLGLLHCSPRPECSSPHVSVASPLPPACLLPRHLSASPLPGAPRPLLPPSTPFRVFCHFLILGARFLRPLRGCQA